MKGGLERGGGGKGVIVSERGKDGSKCSEALLQRFKYNCNVPFIYHLLEEKLSIEKECT